MGATASNFFLVPFIASLFGKRRRLKRNLVIETGAQFIFSWPKRFSAPAASSKWLNFLD
jgi:hypothetical protein